MGYIGDWAYEVCLRATGEAPFPPLVEAVKWALIHAHQKGETEMKEKALKALRAKGYWGGADLIVNDVNVTHESEL